MAQVEWLQPYTDAKIKELGASGVKQLLAVPISFVSEHIETLEEIDMEYRELAIESGVKVRRSPASAASLNGGCVSAQALQQSLCIWHALWVSGATDRTPAKLAALFFWPWERMRLAPAQLQPFSVGAQHVKATLDMQHPG